MDISRKFSLLDLILNLDLLFFIVRNSTLHCQSGIFREYRLKCLTTKEDGTLVVKLHHLR